MGRILFWRPEDVDEEASEPGPRYPPGYKWDDPLLKVPSDLVLKERAQSRKARSAGDIGKDMSYARTPMFGLTPGYLDRKS